MQTQNIQRTSAGHAGRDPRRQLRRMRLMLYHHLPNWPEDRIRPLMETFGKMLLEQRVSGDLRRDLTPAE